jgi:trimeric autotransporter adhesin
MKTFRSYSILLGTLLLCSYGTAAFSQQTGLCYQTPLLLDLAKNGIDLGPAGVGVRFDNNANGIAEHLQWVRPGGDEGFLALDRNGNGVVDNGSELFGNGTPCIMDGTNAPNGFVGLAQYDSRALGGNDDGVISIADAIWNQLRIWVDTNADGVSVLSEMQTLESHQLVTLPTIPRSLRYVDSAGNRIPYVALATTAGSRVKMRVVDVYFLML